MKQKIFLLLGVLIAFSTFASQKVEANYLYGVAQPSRQIIVDKKLKPMTSGNWADNLSLSEVTFTAEDKIDFKLIVKNSGQVELQKVKVIDYLPEDVNFISGTEGYHLQDHQVEWEIEKLQAGEEKELTLQVAVVKSDQLPEADNYCVTNRVRVEAESGESDEDLAQFCLETRILGAKELPEAGAELVLGTVTSLALAGTGLFLKKFKN